MAVALGIGAAVANGMGIAVADDSGANDRGGTASESTTAQDTTAAGASGGVTAGKPRTQNISGGAPISSSRVGKRDDRPSVIADKLERLRERLAASTRAPVSDSTDGDADPTTSKDRTSGSDHTVAGSGARASARSENGPAVTTMRPRAVVPYTTAPHRRPSGARTDDTLNLSNAQSVSSASAPTPTVTATSPTTPQTVGSRLLTATGVITPYGAGTGDVPTAPGVWALSLLHGIRREIERDILNSRGVAPNAVVAVAVAPQPGDTTTTPYGDIGKWMLKSNGDIANWGGKTYQDKELLEPVNVIIIDPTSTTREESVQKLNAAMRASGFPARRPHSTGYYGVIDDARYGQQPSGFLLAYADSEGLADHGRMFGPAPAANGQGFVWTGAFSTQGAGHGYASFDAAGEELAEQLVNSGAATRLDDVYLGNAENTATQTTGDHTGYAIVLVLNPSPPNQPPTATVTQNKPSSVTGSVTGKVTAVDPERGEVTYAGTTTAKGTVTVTSTGTFTYTPTPTARHAAAALNATDDQKVDTFAITVSDEFGNTIAVPVIVAVLGKNAAPSAKATVGKADPLGGTVIGSIAATDADSDDITYTHTTPASGSVTINPDGSFTYTPSEAARQQARAKKAFGTDTFTVTVDDGHGGVKSITVKTSIAPTDRAPVTGALDVRAPVANNGAVKGSLSASDPDGDSFTFTGSTKTSKGKVTVSTGGTFTYTPTAAARRAASSGGDTTDTFTVTVTDKYGATATQTVIVPILGA